MHACSMQVSMFVCTGVTGTCHLCSADVFVGHNALYIRLIEECVDYEVYQILFNMSTEPFVIGLEILTSNILQWRD